jgi:signal transduction histidine kinase
MMAEKPQPEISEIPPEQTPAAVLLVDDDPRNLLALESVLENRDYTLVKARTGDEALLALMNRDIAAVVLDVQMPDLSGIELASLIKQRKRTQNIPIIFLTAHYREDEHAMLGYDVGAVDYLTKPINPAVLRSKINVFVELFRKTRALATANAQLEAQNIALQREAEERSRRIRAEAAQAEAEAANAAKDRFLAILSHELRTPLTPIIYAAALIESYDECPAHVREAVAAIRRNVRLEARLIDDLLDLSRIRSGKLTLQLQTVDAHEVLRDAVKICLGDTARKKVRLIEQLEAENTRINADSARLQQIFWNLLTNAAKFTPEGGTITVRTANPPGTGSLVVEVSDTGIGIEPQQLDRIFEAFEQAESNSSTGMGLGLAICKALVTLHGGTIKAHSNGSGRGASFVVRLPCPKRESAERPSSPPKPARLETLRVLIVEDHQDTADTLRQLLASEGCEVRTAASIAQALEVAEDYEFDILVSDIGLPDGRGTELLDKLQALAGRLIPAIAMSGFGMEDDIERSRLAGFAEHLTKPVEFPMLQQAITRLAAADPEPAGAAG